MFNDLIEFILIFTTIFELIIKHLLVITAIINPDIIDFFEPLVFQILYPPFLVADLLVIQHLLLTNTVHHFQPILDIPYPIYTLCSFHDIAFNGA